MTSRIILLLFFIIIPFLLISQTGNIGIGTSTPTDLLSISSIPNVDNTRCTSGQKVFPFDRGTHTLIAACDNRQGYIRTITAPGFQMTVKIVPEE